MNLAVHGLEGDIREANTSTRRPQPLRQVRLRHGEPPFNVDMVDAEKVKDDRPLPIRLAGSEQGEKGLQRQLPLDFLLSTATSVRRDALASVMSSQAFQRRTWRSRSSAARRGGRLDVMIAIRATFSYTGGALRVWTLTRTSEGRRDRVSSRAASFRKVTRKSMTSRRSSYRTDGGLWLYRGHQDATSDSWGLLRQVRTIEEGRRLTRTVRRLAGYSAGTARYLRQTSSSRVPANATALFPLSELVAELATGC